MLIGLALPGRREHARRRGDGVPALLALRAVEGFGFLVVLPRRELIRRLVAPERPAA